MVDWITQGNVPLKALVRRGDDSLRLDWSTDSAFRFFPVQADSEFGYCLHQADLATNKILTLASRGVIRDYLDAMELNDTYLGLGAMVWAACGKDEGYVPEYLIDMANRHTRYQESDLRPRTHRRVDLKTLKMNWVNARELR